MTTPEPVRCARPAFTGVPEILKDVEAVLRSGRLMMGPFLQAFESEFAAFVGTKHAVALSSCTAALETVLRRLELGGREVVVPTNTFIASGNAVLYAGGTLVLADTDPASLQLSAAELRRRLTPRTAAVLLVHLGGAVSPDLDEIAALCRERGVVLVEDCAHAHGAAFKGRRAGSLGLAGCFSFYPTKIMTTGSGGMLTTDDDGLAEYARSLRLHGRGEGRRGGLDAIENLGNDWFLDEVRCVLGVHQLRGLPAALAARRRVAAAYGRLLASVPGVSPVDPGASCEPSFYKYMVLLPPGTDLADVSRRMLEAGVETEQLYWPPCHLQPVYQRLLKTRAGDFPQAEASLGRQLCLPLHPGVSDDDARRAVDALRSALAAPKASGAR
ncbi:DegT/DnrJ/EryC1/StrS family aminotransferase [bacterium]|nr:MAG: DegT/DnrJ/EryC1/StrS family aminotransferase [bacterium]